MPGLQDIVAAMASSIASFRSHGVSSQKASSRSKGRSYVRARVDHRCEMCGVKGSDSNEFTGMSPHASALHVVYKNGTADFPKGECLKCDNTWKLGGFQEEYQSKEKFMEARDKDPTLQASFIDCTKVWLAAHNSGKRCRPQSTKQQKKTGPNAIDRMADIRQIRKNILKQKGRQLHAKTPLKS